MKWSTITRMFLTLANSFRFVVISKWSQDVPAGGGSNHHWDHGSFLLFSPIELTLSTVLDCSVNILMDTWPPELIRDETPFFSCLDVPHHNGTIDSSPSVCIWYHEAFYFIHLVLWCVLVVQQSFTQGQSICISQQALPCRVFLFKPRWDLSFNNFWVHSMDFFLSSWHQSMAASISGSSCWALAQLVTCIWLFSLVDFTLISTESASSSIGVVF